ncbi:surface lipoprotein assembly modifier [Testudinibacter sp. TR-2022]|uniref:surface lipoprotein assembly modifier n=1 Tax=Testudinibacter sp. TR-2022 TaxID=2585029 RepID=UPI00159BC1E3|nr:surface lipoprotein assembly modifier [Testudinibacter sp. TR-2022]
MCLSSIFYALFYDWRNNRFLTALWVTALFIGSVPATAAELSTLNQQNIPTYQLDNLPEPQQYQHDNSVPTLSAVPTAAPTQQLLKLEQYILPTVLQQMKKGEWQAAQQALAPLLNHVPPSLHGLFLAGQIAEQQQAWQSAVSYYRKMLAIDSSLHRPRLELANALAKSGDIKAAEYQFNLALSQKLPQAVENNVFSRLQHLKDQTTYLNFHFSLVPSSNINQGSNRRSFILDGKEYFLTESSKAKRGLGMQWGINAEKRFGQQYQWFVSGALQHSDFPNKYNDQTVSRLMLGRSFGTQQRHSLDVALGGHHVLYQHKGLYHGGVLRLDYAWRIQPDWRLALSWESQQLHYRPQFDYMRGWQHWATAKLIHLSQGRTSYYWGVQQGFNRAAEKSYAYRTLSWQSGIRHHFDFQQLTLGGHLSYTTTRYLAADPFFRTQRQDKRWNVSADILKRDWSWRGFSPRLSFHYSDNRSNIPIHTNQNKQVRLTFSKEF